MVPALESRRKAQATGAPSAAELYQFSLMSALFEGLYEGEVTYGSLREHGDFGLGTFNDLDGEMVAFDGNFYQLRSDGSAHPVDPEQKTPFAVVTFFKAAVQQEIWSTTTKKDLQELIQTLTSDNLFYAIKVDGLFASVTTRTVNPQKKPFSNLSEAASNQKTSEFRSVKGTLAGFRSPAYAQGVGLPGFYFHFLREDHLAGGHALEYVLSNGTLAIAHNAVFTSSCHKRPSSKAPTLTTLHCSQECAKQRVKD
jgi:acetolactate decarboxylase